MSTRALIGLFLAATAGVVIFLFVSMSRGPDGRIEVGPRTASACSKGNGKDCLPPLTYVDTTGRAYGAEELAGKVVVVNFWATWCKPCEHEIPAFSKVAEHYKGKVVILGVMTDNADPDKLLNFMSDHELTYPVVRVDKDIYLAYQYPDKLPTTFVFDGTGTRRTMHIGPMSEEQLSGVIDQILHD